MARTLAQIQADLDAIQATVRRYDAGYNEGGEGFNPHAEALRRLEREYDAVAEAEAEARVTAIRLAEVQEWTRNLTIARRAEWNAWVKAQGPQLHTAQVAAQIQRQGWSLEALKAAIKRHRL